MKDAKTLFCAGALALAVILAGCAQSGTQQTVAKQGTNCEQGPAPAVSPDGKTCYVFLNTCDIPGGYTRVENCPAAQPAAPQQSQGTATLPLSQKYQFDVNMAFCKYSPGFPKGYNLLYQIRNYSDNIPPVGSTVTLEVPDINYSSPRLIERLYEKGRIIWEDEQYNFLGIDYHGKLWEITNVDQNRALDFKLVFCEPQGNGGAPCSDQNGLVIDQGNTATTCT